MKSIKQKLTAGLKEYLINENEQVLTEAYELGRDSLKRGIGELELIVLYHEVISELHIEQGLFSSQDMFNRAGSYLTDVLAPFEIRQRGYKELINKLNKKNNLLEEEVEKRRKTEQALKESKDKFQSLIENALDIVAVLNFDGTIRYINPSVERVLAYTPEELKGEKVFKYLHPDDISMVREIVEGLNESPGKVASAEFRFQHKLGGWVILESVANSVTDSQDGMGIIVNSRDITYRIKFRRELEDKSRQLEEAQHIARVGSWEWKPDAGENELLWSNEMLRIYGLSSEEFGRSYDEFRKRVHPDDIERVEALIQEAIETGNPFEFEHRIICPNGQERIAFCKGEVVAGNTEKSLKLVGICQDVTEQKDAEERLRTYSVKLRKLSAKVEQAREEERIRIAREIHDELGQMLTVLKMEFSIMMEKVAREKDDPQYEEFMDEKEHIKKRVDTILKSVQRIATELRPEVLDDLGLVEAIEWQAQEFENRTGIRLKIKMEVEDTSHLEEERSTAMFRIFQETLTNVARHAEATQVNVHLYGKAGVLYLKVNDNGIGISNETVSSTSSLGIVGMKERAQLLGGNLQINGEPGVGTTIVLEMPVNASAYENLTEMERKND